MGVLIVGASSLVPLSPEEEGLGERGFISIDALTYTPWDGCDASATRFR